jgi:hypothetical protein
MKKLSKLLILSALMSATPVYGQSLEFKEIKLAGSGCKPGTTTNIFSPDGTSASILFDDLFIEIPQYSGDNDNDEFSDDNEDITSKFDKNLNRKVCLMNITTKVPRGYKISALDLSFDYRGSTFTEKGTLTSFKTKLINFQGPSGRRQYPEKLLGTKRFRENSDTDFTLSQTRTLPIQSKCSSNRESISKFAIKNTIMAKTISRFAHLSPEAFIALDSADLQAKVKFKVKLIRCSDTSSNSRDHGHNYNNNDNSRVNYLRQRCSRQGGSWDSRRNECKNSRSRSTRRSRHRR